MEHVGFRQPRIWMMLLAISFFSIVLVGCSQSRPKIILEASVQLSTVGSQQLQDGTITVIVGTDRDVDLTVGASSSDGILFKLDESYEITSDRRAAQVFDLSLRTGERRTLRFQYEVDPDMEVSGEYFVNVAAFDAKGGDEPLAETTTVTYVVMSGGDPRFLATEEDYLELMSEGYELDESGYRAMIELLPEDRPKGGILTIQVRSPKDEYAPEIDVSVTNNGGIIFSSVQDGTSGGEDFAVHLDVRPINNKGSRIFRIPFRLNPNSLDGTYVIEVSTSDEDETTDRLPVRIRVSSSTLGSGDKWLSLEFEEDR